MLSTKLIAFLGALSIFLLVSGIKKFRPSRGLNLAERINGARLAEVDAILKGEDRNTWYGKHVYDPYMRPIVNGKMGSLQKISKLLGVNMEEMDSQIREAELHGKISTEEIMSMKILGLGGMLVLLTAGISMGFNIVLVVLGFVVYLMGSTYPQRFIKARINKRRETIEKDLPDFLDLLKSVTESGLIIQEAINKVSLRMDGPLSREFQNVVVETKANGGQWRVAMENMAFRNDIDAVSDVISDILITHERGTSIVDTLAKEADIMRKLRNSRAMEKAKGLSVKMILPMAVFSFIPLLVLMLGPLMMGFMKSMN